MKNLLLIASLLFAVCAHAQENPFVATTQAISSPTGASLVLSMFSSYEGRGVAGVEQLRDELPALHADVLAGAVKSVEEIRQPALKELFEEISQNKEAMNKVRAAHPEKSDLVALTLSVSKELL